MIITDLIPTGDYGVIIGALLMIYATLIGTAVLSRAVSSFIKGIRS